MVLEPLTREELNNILDEKAKNIISYFIDRAIEFQPELRVGQKIRPILIPKEHIEQWLVQALALDSVGSGSYPVDVICENKYAADIKSLTCKVNKNGELSKALSGEASLGQKFEDGLVTLDELFVQGNHTEIINKWIKILNKKYTSVLNDKNIKDIYFFFFLNHEVTFHFCGCKLNIDAIDDISLGKMTSNSVFVSNFINDNYGEVKIYKAKKRMELRLRPLNWVKDNKVITFTSNKNLKINNLRDIF